MRDVGVRGLRWALGWSSLGLASVIMVQPAQATTVGVTQVSLNPTTGGLALVLELTDGAASQVLTSQVGTTWIADVSNAQLSAGLGWGQQHPTEGIESVTVSVPTPTSVRITIVGSSTLPVGEVVRQGNTLTITFAPGADRAAVATDPSTVSIARADHMLQGEPGGTAADLYAQETLEPEPTEAADEDDGTLRIFVTGEQEGSEYFEPTSTTGTRTDTPLIEVPQSIQVIPQQVLEDQQVIQLDEALTNVSGVVGSTVEGSGFRFAIRGFDRANVLRDGFNISASDNTGRSGFQTLSETANLEQIEVLRGPASILYGEINPGGIINLVTKQPLYEPFFGAELQVGSNSLIRPSVDLSGPLTDDANVRYRVNAVVENSEGFRGFTQNIQRTFIAPVIAWDISDRTRLTVEAEYLDDQRPYDTGTVAFGRGILNIPRDRIANEPSDFRRTSTLMAGYTFTHEFNDDWRVYNAFRYISDRSQGRVAIPFNFNETTGTLLRLDAATNNYRESYALQTNIVGEFETGSIGHTLLLGVDLSQTNVNLLTTGSAVPLPLNIFNPVYNLPRSSVLSLVGLNEFNQTRRLGLYAQDQISFGDALILVAGVRYDTVHQTLDAKATTFPTPGAARNLSQSPSAVTPRIGLVYQPIPEIALYGSYSRSFTPNAGLNSSGVFLPPEEGEGYEVGVKAELLEGNLFATLAYFDITKQNVASPDPAFPVTANVFVSTGRQRSRGLEFDLGGELAPGWNVIASYAYTDATVTADTVTPVGNRLVGIPEHSVGLWSHYTIQEGDLAGLGFGLGVNYVGTRTGDLSNSFQMGSYFLTNAALSYERDNWKIALNVKNLFDVFYVQGSPFSRFRNIEVGEPLTIVASFSIEL